MERKFREREKAFEEVFFRKENERMLQRIRDERRQETERAELARACGIQDAGWLLNLPPREPREEHEVLDQIARAFEPASPP
jgi:hypothetical protein